jgi:mRNA interferase RelE/StbE
MDYSVTIKPSALKEIEKLSKDVASRVMAKAAALATNPRPPGCVKLAGADQLWRVRIGDYRIVYHVNDTRKNVDIRIVAHRREVYRDM